jgi:hypothetical protein
MVIIASPKIFTLARLKMREIKYNNSYPIYYSNYSILFDDLIMVINAANNSINTDKRIIRFNYRFNYVENNELLYYNNYKRFFTKDLYINYSIK